MLSFQCSRLGLPTVVEEVNTFICKIKHHAVVVAEKVDQDELQPYDQSAKLRFEVYHLSADGLYK